MASSTDVTLRTACLTAAFCSAVAALYVAVAVEPASRLLFFISFAPQLAVCLWLQKEARRAGVGSIQDWGFFLLLFWPVLIPWYAFKTRGISGWRWPRAFFSLPGRRSSPRPPSACCSTDSRSFGMERGEASRATSRTRSRAEPPDLEIRTLGPRRRERHVADHVLAREERLPASSINLIPTLVGLAATRSKSGGVLGPSAALGCDTASPHSRRGAERSGAGRRARGRLAPDRDMTAPQTRIR